MSAMLKDTRKRVQSLLGDFHDQAAGCEMAAVVDLSSAIVLCTSEQTTLPQDRLDAVAAGFGGAGTDHALAALRALDDVTGFIATARRDGDGVAVSVSDAAADDEAIICRFSGLPEIDGVCAVARAVSAVVQTDGEAAQ